MSMKQALYNLNQSTPVCFINQFVLVEYLKALFSVAKRVRALMLAQNIDPINVFVMGQKNLGKSGFPSEKLSHEY